LASGEFLLSRTKEGKGKEYTGRKRKGRRGRDEYA